MAVEEGFEPSDGGYPSHAFEACSLGHSDTPPRRSVRVEGSERVGGRLECAVGPVNKTVCDRAGSARKPTALPDLPAEEFTQECCRFIGQDSGNDFGPMVKPAVAYEIPHRSRRTRLLIVRTKDNAINTG